jgi:hypothetical protein
MNCDARPTVGARISRRQPRLLPEKEPLDRNSRLTVGEGIKKMGSRHSPSHLLAFGRHVSLIEEMTDPVAPREWQSKPGPLRRTQNLYLFRYLHGNNTAQAAEDPSRLAILSTADLPSLDFVEWHYIDFVLSCAQSMSQAAETLGIRRSTLYRKRKKQPPAR